MTAQLAPLPQFRNWDNNGNPLYQGQLFTYVAGTTTPQASYTDSTQGTPNPNPVILNARGESSIWLDPTLMYKLVLKDSLGNTIWTQDQVPGGYVPLAQLASLTTSVIIPVLVGTTNTPILASYVRTAAEIAAGVTPTNFAYPPGDLRRYGAKIDGVTDDTTAINNAIACAVAASGIGYIFHPGGVCCHASQITIPNNLAVIGISRALAIFKFTGSPSGSPAATRSAWRYTGVAPWSGYANVMFRHVTLWYQNAVNFAAALEINAWGWAYWDIYDVWVKGACSYGIILDGAEICSVHNCLIENTNATANTNIWIVNGADRGFTQGTGFSNVISIRENQISAGAGSIGLVDDGGNAHTICSNNFNQHRIPIQVAGVTGFKTYGNSYETTLANGPANVLFGAASAAGNPVGPCSGISMEADGFFGSISSGSLLAFQGTLYTITGISKASSAIVTVNAGGSANPFVVGAPLFITGVSGMTQINGLVGYVTALGGSTGAWTATLNINSSGFSAYTSGGQGQMMHFGAHIHGCNFGANSGRGAAIDVSFLGNSVCEANNDLAGTSPGGTGMFHYTGVHNDACGNRLMEPNNGFTGTTNISGPTFGDTRFPTQFEQAATFFGQIGLNGAAPPSQVTGWGSPTGTGVIANFPGATATLAQCSQAIAQIISDLKAMGRYGA